jgi:hypothetical protein
MKALILPLILGLVGLGAGIGAGIMLKPEPEVVSETTEDGEDKANEDDASGEEAEYEDAEETDAAESEFARMSNQFIVPVIKDEEVDSLVVLSITIEVDPGETTTVFQREPRLRDRFLRVLFDHANIGGFDAGFTQSGTLEILRKALKEAAKESLGKVVRDILIVDIMRQEV